MSCTTIDDFSRDQMGAWYYSTRPEVAYETKTLYSAKRSLRQSCPHPLHKVTEFNVFEIFFLMTWPKKNMNQEGSILKVYQPLHMACI